MPVVTRKQQPLTAGRHQELARMLAAELTNPREYGQPMVEQEEFARTKLVGVTVIWDRFADCIDVERPGVIQEAYQLAGQAPLADRSAYLIGYTVPEAVEAGLLDHFVLLAPARGTPPDQLAKYHEAMVEAGASLRLDPSRPQLRFQDADQAAACRRALLDRFPGTDNVWIVGHGVRMFASPDAAGTTLYISGTR